MSKYGGYEIHEFTAEFYDITHDRVHQKDIEFFIDYSKKAGSHTLELGCGTGRVLISTAVSGIEITGLDISPYMLKICQEKLDQHPEEVRNRVRLIQGNMTDFDTGEKYSLITMPFRPFQHLISAAEQKACLTCAHKHLIPHGRLIIDIFHPKPQRLVPDSNYLEEVEDIPETEMPDGRKIRRTNRTASFHRDQQYNEVELIYYVTHPDGRQQRLVQSFPFRYLFRYEMEHLLTLCGFKVVELFGDFDKSEFSTDSPEMIFVVERNI